MKPVYSLLFLCALLTLQMRSVAQDDQTLKKNGSTVTSNAQFSYGFSVDKKNGIEIFVFDKPSFP